MVFFMCGINNCVIFVVFILKAWMSYFARMHKRKCYIFTVNKKLYTVKFQFDRVNDLSKENKMGAHQLAIVFGPTLIWPEVQQQNLATSMVYQSRIVEYVLLEYPKLFRWDCAYKNWRKQTNLYYSRESIVHNVSRTFTSWYVLLKYHLRKIKSCICHSFIFTINRCYGKVWLRIFYNLIFSVIWFWYIWITEELLPLMWHKNTKYMLFPFFFYHQIFFSTRWKYS